MTASPGDAVTWMAVLPLMKKSPARPDCASDVEKLLCSKRPSPKAQSSLAPTRCCNTAPVYCMPAASRCRRRACSMTSRTSLRRLSESSFLRLKGLALKNSRTRAIQNASTASKSSAPLACNYLSLVFSKQLVFMKRQTNAGVLRDDERHAQRPFAVEAVFFLKLRQRLLQ